MREEIRAEIVLNQSVTMIGHIMMALVQTNVLPRETAIEMNEVWQSGAANSTVLNHAEKAYFAGFLELQHSALRSLPTSV